MRKPVEVDGSSTAMDAEPVPIAMPVSRAAMASSRLMAAVRVVPPVIPLMYRGADQRMPST